jgi:hypothetical protein
MMKNYAFRIKNNRKSIKSSLGHKKALNQTLGIKEHRIEFSAQKSMKL